MTTNLAHEKAVGLVMNFAAAYVVSDLSNLIYLAIDSNFIKGIIKKEYQRRLNEEQTKL